MKPTNCYVCSKPLTQPAIGRPRTTCSTACRLKLFYQRQRVSTILNQLLMSADSQQIKEIESQLTRKEKSPCQLEMVATSA